MGLFETESKCTIDYMLCYKTFEAKITCEQNWCIVQYIFTFSWLKTQCNTTDRAMYIKYDYI